MTSDMLGRPSSELEGRERARSEGAIQAGWGRVVEMTEIVMYMYLCCCSCPAPSYDGGQHEAEKSFQVTSLLSSFLSSFSALPFDLHPSLPALLSPTSQ
jgi:hypothetical protein